MDNLRLLEAMPDESVDLISIDPPFGKMDTFLKMSRQRPIIQLEMDEERRLFEKHGLSIEDWQQRKQLLVEDGSVVDDIFTWDDKINGNRSHKAFYDRITVAETGSMARRVHRVIEATRETAGDNQAAYICFMAVRMVHCYRVLKPTGSIYVHCDHKSNSHLRMLMDAIFGAGNMRNTLMWKRYRGKRAAAEPQRYANIADTILFYAKSNESKFDLPFTDLDPKYVKKTYVNDDHDGRGPYRFGGRFPDRKYYLSNSRGTPLTNWWDDIPELNGRSQEMAGYVTQKPLALARRIIEASTDPGDLVLDVFAGCATTLVAAEGMDRRWIGCDMAYRAWTMNKRRFVLNPDEFGGPMMLTGTTDATLKALHIEGIPIPEIDSFTIGPPDIEGMEQYPIAKFELAVAQAQRRDPRWTGRYTPDEAKKLLLEAWGPICWGCGWEPRKPDGLTPNPFYLQLDHSLARALGGEDELYNLGLLCTECNGRKSAREMEIAELRRENERRGDALHMGLAELERRVPLLRVRKWAQGKMDERPRLVRARASGAV